MVVYDFQVLPLLLKTQKRKMAGEGGHRVQTKQRQAHNISLFSQTISLSFSPSIRHVHV